MNKLIIITGIVLEILGLTTFKVRLKDKTIINATISRHVNLEFDIYIGVEVPIDMSPFDKTRGRINTLNWKRHNPKK